MSSQIDFSLLPSVDRVLEDAGVVALCARCDSRVVTGWVREAVDELRVAMRAGQIGGNREELVRAAVEGTRQRMEVMLAPRLRRVVNGTGIVLHTNLGRAPLPKVALERIAELAGGYSNLELDLETGGRGSRTDLVEELLCTLTGAEAAAVVNNNAAAVLLTLNTLAQSREAVISRGQLIEIGGSFRIPDLMARSGAIMVEVGTTNRTHLRDFEEAMNEKTGLMLAVHPSNYLVRGFTAEVALADLVALGKKCEVPVAHDLGGGVLVDLRSYGLPYEPLVSDSVSAGADVVTFSGDKVLGGPQAGILVGKRAAIEAIRKNPMMRALRCGKLTYAALEATLALYLNPKELLEAHPTLRMLTEPVSLLRRRGRRLLKKLSDIPGLTAELVDSVAQAGSGALPLEKIKSVAVALSASEKSATEVAARLRMYSPAVLGYVREDRVLLDLRTIGAEELGTVEEGVRRGV